jgi:hypothetical protein
VLEFVTVGLTTVFSLVLLAGVLAFFVGFALLLTVGQRSRRRRNLSAYMASSASRTTRS